MLLTELQQKHLDEETRENAVFKLSLLTIPTQPYSPNITMYEINTFQLQPSHR